MNRVYFTRRELLLFAGVAGVVGLSGAAVECSRVTASPDLPKHDNDLQDRAVPSTGTLKFADPLGHGSKLQNSMIWTSGPETPDTHFVAFRKRFEVENISPGAMLHLFVDVRYMLWINGAYVNRGPARFNPKGPEYDTIPMGTFLKSGHNTIVVMVMANASNGKMMRHTPGLTAMLETAGNAIVSTDSTWKWSDQTRYRAPNVEWGNVHDRIDASLEGGDWTLSDFDDASWHAAAPIDGSKWGQLSSRRIPLLRETLMPVKLDGGKAFPITLSAGQEISFDLGRLVQAYTTLALTADPDSTLRLTHADISYVARIGRQTYISSDTCGFQTATLQVTAGSVTIHEFGAVERLYPFDCIGRFRSSDSLLNDIWDMCARSVLVMSEDSYVDCADRERTEWMDDDPPAFDITRTAFAGPASDGGLVYSDPRLFEELLRRTALTQQPDGWVKAHTCSDRFDIHAYMEDRSCDWVQGARQYYECTHKADVIREIWPVIVTQMDWFLSHRTSRGLVRAREWVVWGNPMGYQTCEGTGLNVFVYKALVDAAYLGNVLGETAQAAVYEKAAVALSGAVNTVLWNVGEGTYYSGYYDAGDANTGHLKVVNGLAEPTMYPALFALDQGIVPEARRAQVTKYLLGNRTQPARIMTLYYLFKQLYNQQDPFLDREVIDIIRTKWRDMAQTGWKVSWEEFEGGSKAHIYGSFPGYFLSSYVLGVRLDGPVWERRLLIEPRLGDLSYAEGVVVTEFGPVAISWKVEEGRIGFHLTTPAGVTARLRVPHSGSKPVGQIDGKRLRAQTDGSFLTINLSGGSHSGTVPYVNLPLRPVNPVTTRSSDASQSAFESDLVRNSLIGAGQPSYLATTDEKCTNAIDGTSADSLRNNTTLNASGGPDTQNDGRTFRGYGTGDAVTFRLNTSLHPAGYNITKITTFAGHKDGRASQHYSVSIALVSDPSKFAILVPDAAINCGGGSSEIIIQNPKGGALVSALGDRATGVAAVRFDFQDGPAGFNVYREIQIIGL